MAGIIVRNLSDDTKERLRQRAVRHRRSLEAEVRSILEQATQAGANAGDRTERFPDWFHPHDAAGRRSRPGHRREPHRARGRGPLILLDTNVLSELVKPEPDPLVVGWTRRSSGALALPTIAVAEMAHGIEKLVSGRRREDEIVNP